MITDTQEECHVRRHRQKTAINEPRRERRLGYILPHCPQKEPTLPTPCFWTSSLQDCEAVNTCCCVSPLVCGTSLHHPQETNKDAHTKLSSPRQNKASLRIQLVKKPLTHLKFRQFLMYREHERRSSQRHQQPVATGRVTPDQKGPRRLKRQCWDACC